MKRPNKAALEALYLVATDAEAEKLDELRERARLLWRCAAIDHGAVCGWINDKDAPRCDGCRAPRPTAS